MTQPAGLHAIGQVSVGAPDLGRAVAFYRDVLGLPFLFEVPGQLAFFDCDGVRLMLDKPEGPEFDHASSTLYFRTPDINTAHSELSAKGVQFRGDPHLIARMPDHELWMAFFDDGEENVMALMSEVR